VITIYLLRHAQSAPPVVNTSEVPLSEAGLESARGIVPILSSLGIQRIVSSPCQRAVQTVIPFAKGFDIEIEIDHGLREREMPIASESEAHMERVRDSFADFNYAPDQSESFHEVEKRALACLKQLAEESPVGLLLVGHGQCLSLILRDADNSVGFSFWKSLKTPAIVKLEMESADKPVGFQLVN